MNRRKTCPTSLPRPKGKQRVEYPYASTTEGGGIIGKTQSRKMIDAGHNRQGGTQLAKFYDAHRIIPGDTFYARTN
ncbi:NucA/NucB deoxyribonuclease domain-containing protein [Streptomyces sp. NBC_00090]|uniref:NucA/NucB deoxyribonuclease domain-containing protein n=1 Tax=Streptomyces sp. NBC_00090 TaxID=2903619 RepID=UPI00324FDD58